MAAENGKLDYQEPDKIVCIDANDLITWDIGEDIYDPTKSIGPICKDFYLRSLRRSSTLS